MDGQGSDGRQLRQRVSSWAYDVMGRARLSVRGEVAVASTAAASAPSTFTPPSPARHRVGYVDPVHIVADGDFQEAEIFNGKPVREGWYINKKTGRKIETDY